MKSFSGSESRMCDQNGLVHLSDESFSPKIQGENFRIVGDVLLAYLGNESYVRIPCGIKAIGKEAFKNNLAIRKVAFPKTVKRIESNAFEGCINLVEIIDYSNVSEFGDECFRSSGLKNVTIGRNVEYLGRGCFSMMPNLKAVSYFPGKILRLNQTFAYCPNLVEVDDELYFFHHATFFAK